MGRSWLSVCLSACFIFENISMNLKLNFTWTFRIVLQLLHTYEMFNVTNSTRQGTYPNSLLKLIQHGEHRTTEVIGVNTSIFGFVAI
jgi:hypothetical protein